MKYHLVSLRTRSPRKTLVFLFGVIMKGIDQQRSRNIAPCKFRSHRFSTRDSVKSRLCSVCSVCSRRPTVSADYVLPRLVLYVKVGGIASRFGKYPIRKIVGGCSNIDTFGPRQWPRLVPAVSTPVRAPRGALYDQAHHLENIYTVELRYGLW